MFVRRNPDSAKDRSRRQEADEIRRFFIAGLYKVAEEVERNPRKYSPFSTSAKVPMTVWGDIEFEFYKRPGSLGWAAVVTPLSEEPAALSALDYLKNLKGAQGSPQARHEPIFTLRLVGKTPTFDVGGETHQVAGEMKSGERVMELYGLEDLLGRPFGQGSLVEAALDSADLLDDALRLTFTHEYAHWQNSWRISPEAHNASVLKAEKSMRGYEEDPDEFDARYHATLSRIEDLLYRQPGASLRVLGKGFDSFVNTARKHGSEQLAINLEPGNPLYRHAIKRLHGDYRRLREEYAYALEKK